MASETVIQTLQAMETLQDLPPELLRKLANLACEVSFAENQILFREADIGEFVYLIDEGQVALDIRVPGRGRATILTVGPGQMLGWSALFPSGHKTAGARAVKPTRAIALNAAQLREAMQEDHELGCAMLWRVAEVIAGRLKATRLQLLDIFAHEPAQ